MTNTHEIWKHTPGEPAVCLHKCASRIRAKRRASYLNAACRDDRLPTRYSVRLVRPVRPVRPESWVTSHES